MQKKKRQTNDEALTRAVAATERARAKLLTDKNQADEVDIKRVPLSWWRERWSDKNVRRLFIENFIYVRDAFDKNKLVLLKLNDMQDDLYRKLTGKDVILKMRKGGSSTLQLAIKFSNAVVLSGRNVRVFAHNPQTEAKFRRDVRTMYRKLPDHIRPRAEQFTQEVIELQDAEKGTVDSIVTTTGVQPGFEDNPRGDTITDALVTEVPFMRGDPRKAALAIIEACAPDADVTVESTAGGVEFFHGLYQDGKKNQGGWTSHFYEWWWRRSCRVEGALFKQLDGKWILLRPGDAPVDALKNLLADIFRSKLVVTSHERKICARILLFLINRGYVPKGTKWHAPEVAEYLAWRRRKIEEIGEDKFTVEYPENDKDCFTQTGRPLIRADYLKVECKPSDAVEGCEYLIAADTSLGLQSGDPAAIQVLDIHGGRQCREIVLTVAPDLLALTLAALSDQYNGAQIVVERNGPGIATIIKLIELGYESRLYKHLDARHRRAVEDGRLSYDEAEQFMQHGFPTTAETKPLLGVKLEEGIRTGALGLSSEEFCDEAKTVVWFDDRSWGAMPGYHDDRVMALAIGWYVTRTQMGHTGFIGVMPETGDAR